MRKKEEIAMQTHHKYRPFTPIDLPDRRWPDNVIAAAPTWCSVDLRDGNQALVTPMNLTEKLEFFRALVDVGFKEIEVGFPSASQTEYEILRTLIERGHIPEDVTIQVLVQAREHLIRKTFEAVAGARNVIVHFYNSTSALQRKVVFQKDMRGITDIAVAGARLIRQLADERDGADGRIRFEYSPESFSGTEGDFAVEICQRVMEELRATAQEPVILNLPSTVEMCTPNTYADQIEYFARRLPRPEAAILSVHPHNDRGTGVACAELAMLAGARRVEGTLFGNGERTGNLDIVTMALNMHTQGVDCGLDFSHIDELRDMYERTTKMRVPERQPYAGKLAFTAFSGSHQDAINKGFQHMAAAGAGLWEVPYLPIDPADVGRAYEPVIRINSQSGKGGAAFIMSTIFGYHLPKEMHPEFGGIVQRACEAKGDELSPDEILALFERSYLALEGPYRLTRYAFHEEAAEETAAGVSHFTGALSTPAGALSLDGRGNGPIDAFFHALDAAGIARYAFLGYHEHAISRGSDSKAIAYIQLKAPGGRSLFGVGVASNINVASVRGILCAINRAEG
jgi:2-isopropylmalate synthase